MKRTFFIEQLDSRLKEKRKFIQVVVGPRQIGKTIVISQFLQKVNYDYISESADAITENTTLWIDRIWTNARLKEKTSKKQVLVVIDEVQKLENWSEVIKKYWDEDTKNKVNIKVILSGSSRLLLEKGLTESLMGRFELIYMTHWSFLEMQKAFDFSLEQYIYFGGYPGPAELIKDEARWKNYIRDSIIESSISKDILMLTPITKPALLRQLFTLGSVYSSQILPYNKMLGTLTDCGNTVTLANYLTLLDQSGLLGGLQKFSGSEHRVRSSSPKLQVFNNALFASVKNTSFEQAKSTPDLWGRFVESCVGTHLINNRFTQNYELFYWRDGNDEVDFVITRGDDIVALEVKSGLRKSNTGMSEFKKRYPLAKIYVVSSDAFSNSSCILLEDFLQMTVTDLF